MRKILRIVPFVLGIVLSIFSILYLSIVIIVYGSTNDSPDRRSSLFYYLPENSVDVIFAGTSHIYCSFIPKKIYDDTGITSGMIATSSQSFQNTYWVLKEALKKQSPKVVVMDVHNLLACVDTKVQNFNLHYTSGLSILPDYSFTKYMALLDVRKGPYENAKISLKNINPFFLYRNEPDKFNNVTTKDILRFYKNPVNEYKTFVFFVTETVTPLESLNPFTFSKKYVDMLSTFEFEYLLKILNLCQANGIQLILTRMPYNAEHFDDCHIYEQFEQWVISTNIMYVDFFKLIDDTNIDLSTDFRDSDHLNLLGAEKATDYFETNILSNFIYQEKDDYIVSIWKNMKYPYNEAKKRIISKIMETE